MFSHSNHPQTLMCCTGTLCDGPTEGGAKLCKSESNGKEKMVFRIVI